MDTSDMSPKPDISSKLQTNLNWDFINLSPVKTIHEFGKQLESCIKIYYHFVEEFLLVQKEVEKYKEYSEILEKKIQTSKFCSQCSSNNETKPSSASEIDLKKTVCKASENNSSNISPELKKMKIENNIFEESICEINGTPTCGRTSPIIGARRLRSRLDVNLSENKTRISLLHHHNSPVKRQVKLSTCPRTTKTKERGKVKLKQSRLCLTNTKPNKVLDVSIFGSESKHIPQFDEIRTSTEDEDVILPSPNADMVKKEPLSMLSERFDSKSHIRSPAKHFKPPLNCTKAKSAPKKENASPNKQRQRNAPRECTDVLTPTKNKRLSPRKSSPPSPNCTRMDNTEISLTYLREVIKKETDPVKEQIREAEPEFIYKEEVLRKKADKIALPGQFCEECKEFYADMYKNDPEMLRKKLDECSKHRSRFDPERYKHQTSPSFWRIQADMPADTIELNRMNGVL